jgi:hypothetical protein
MKYLRPILTGLAVASLAASAASAATTIRITGSTAYRAAVVTAVEHLMSSGYHAAIKSSAPLYTAGDEMSATESVFVGNINGANNPVTIQCAWAGSVGGVKTIVQDIKLTNWMSSSNVTSDTVALVSAPAYDAKALADITMSDTKQSSTPFPTPQLSGFQVGVVPFIWLKSNGAPSSLTNITALLGRAVLSGGARLSQFTGVSTDTAMVYAVGRDQDSGTRVAALADSGYGSLTNPVQFRLNGSGSVTTAETYPANTVLGTTYPIATSGYSGGGNVVSALNLTGSISAPVYDTTISTVGDPDALIADGAYYVGYVGTSDAKKLTGHTQNSSTGIFTSTGDLQVLSYNGVPYSYENVREGRYSFWTYEWALYKSLTPDQLTVYTALKNQIHDTDATASGILISTMHVSRTIEGGVITHN